MSANTAIEWTRNDDGTPGRTWNPVTGCTKISDGCTNCYAETIAERFRGHAAFPNGFDVQVRANKVNDPLTWRKPTRVFVNSMSDLFHADIDQAWIADVFAVMAAAQKHTFQLLTKRHARMRSLLNSPEFVAQVRSRALGKGLSADQWQWPISNLWLGVSVENQEWADIRIRPLMQTPAVVRFLSCEPLLGPIQFHRGHTHCPTHDFPGGFCTGGCPDLIAPNWVIVGGESGRQARPMNPQWATSLRDQCAEADIPYFFKQWGEWAPSGYLVIRSRPEPGSVLVGEPVDEHGHRVELRRIGKKAAGRELDGITHDAFPEPQR